MWGIFLITSDYFWILAATVLYGIFYAPQIAFLEAFTMDWLGGERKRYGAMRAWGSLSFICVVLAMGRIIEQRGVGIILVLILAGSWLQAVAAFGLPRTVAHRRGLSGKFWRQLLKPRLAVFWCCAFFMLFSHGAYYAFFSIHLSQLGFGSGFIGLCWALASCAEVVIMLNSRRLFKRFSYETVMMVAFVAAVIRWGGMGVARSAWSLILLQLTHTLTYGAFHMASILYTDHWAPDEDKTLAQSVNNAVTYGLGLMAGFFLSGALYERIGANGMFAVSALIALVGAVAFGIFILVMRRLAPYSIMGSR